MGSRQADNLFAGIVELMVTHVAGAPAAGKHQALVEALAAARASGDSLHALVCQAPAPCPIQEAEELAQTMVEDMQGAVDRAFNLGGWVQ